MQKIINLCQKLLNNKWVMLILVLTAILLRLKFVDNGFYSDLDTFSRWAKIINNESFAGAYLPRDTDLVDYPPAYLYVLGASAWVQTNIFHGEVVYPEFGPMLKVPLIAVDLFLALLIWKIVLRLKQSKTLANAAALVVLFNPYLFYSSTIWGQVDNFAMLIVLAGLYFLLLKRMRLAASFLALALLFKFQVIIFYPLLAIYLWRCFKPKEIIAFCATYLIATIIFLLPVIFTNQLPGMLQVYENSPKRWPYLSMNAYNLWWIVSHNFGEGWIPDSIVAFAGISYKQIALLLFAAAYALICIFLWLKKNERSFFIALAFASLFFFNLNTEMHERYMYPFFILALPFIFDHARNFVLYLILSIIHCLNLIFVLPPYDSFTKLIRPIFTHSTNMLSVLNTLITLLLIGWLIWQIAKTIFWRRLLKIF